MNEHVVVGASVAALLKAEKQFRTSTLRVNQNIRTYNLKTPPGIPHLVEINVERELVKLRRLSGI